MGRNSFHSICTSKLSSGALQLAVIISFIVIVLCSFFIMQLYLSSRFVDEGQRITRKIHSTQSAITATLAKLSLSPSHEVLVYNNDSVDVTVSQWGLFFMIQAQIKGQFPIKQAYLLGMEPDTSVSLFVANDEQYLGITGTSIIQAKAYVPRLGIRPEYIGSTGFSGTFGKTEKSTSELPEFTHATRKQIEELYALLHRPLGYTQEFNDSICQSFFDSTVIIENPEYIGRYMRGNIIMISDKSIELSHVHNCKDIICIAPYIRIKSGFKGALQLFATDSIVIDSDVILENPSVVCLYTQKMQSKETPKIILSDRSIVAGTIFFYAPDMYKNYARIEIQNDAIVYGTIISHNYVEHYGNVYGSIYTKYFFTKNSRGIYKNLLTNGSIKRIEKPEYFLATQAGNEQKRWKQFKKLY